LTVPIRALNTNLSRQAAVKISTAVGLAPCLFKAPLAASLRRRPITLPQRLPPDIDLAIHQPMAADANSTATSIATLMKSATPSSTLQPFEHSVAHLSGQLLAGDTV
jgi:hypothetical protein